MFPTDKIMKHRTKGTAFMVHENIKEFTFEELVESLFVWSEKEEVVALIKKFETQMIECYMNFDNFTAKLHSFYKETAIYIKKNNLYRTYFDFTYYIKSNFEAKNINKKIIYAYYDLLMQAVTYFSPLKLIIGLSLDNKSLLIRNEVYPCLDYPLFEFQQKYHKMPTPAESSLLWSMFKKYGYSINDMSDLEYLFLKEQVIDCMVSELSFLIDEKYENMFPFPYCDPNDVSIPPKHRDTAFYYEQIKNRKYILPNKGVVAKYDNTASIKEILFREKFVGDTIFLLFKIEFKEGGYSSGYYDCKHQLCQTEWQHTSSDGLRHRSLENFILQNYYLLVCDVKDWGKDSKSLEVIENILEVPFYDKRPYVEFSHKQDTENIADKKEHSYYLDRSKYSIVGIDVNPYIRKLPVGYQASEEAISKAKVLGIELAEGETFVQKFKKNVLKK